MTQFDEADLLCQLNSALVGFLMALTPLSCALMGWRGASGGGAATMYVITTPYPPLILNITRRRSLTCAVSIF